MNADDVIKELDKLADPVKARFLQGFFKTGKGQYAEGDQFIGITVPLQRQIAKRFKNLELREIQKLLDSSVHEHRLTALEILVMQYEMVNASGSKKSLSELEKEKAHMKKEKLVRFYLKNTKRINNWDLVDASAPYILGDWLISSRFGEAVINPKLLNHSAGNDERKILFKLADSKQLWERRIAIVATLAFIRKGEFSYTLCLAKKLMSDDQDLIHKATGWMLREVGKRSERDLAEFLDEHHGKMPRTMLRYAIERLPESKRKRYLLQK